MQDPRFEARTRLTEADILELERNIGRALPADYRNFLKTYGGAFVGGLVDGSRDLPILEFLGRNGILAKLRDPSDLREEGILPFARCELGNAYVFDIDNTVHYINYYGGNTSARKVASSFSDLIERIVTLEE